ncbi:MAG: substrate-binding domain-containing protein, partial [Prevotellaceae bacterium]|nr:substrate-binding domain-containing protein [Prevotellaceae bacterium]
MKRVLFITAICTVFFACKSGKKNDESPTRGAATVLVDEAVYPMVDGQARVFENQYKYATLRLLALPEQAIAQMLVQDSARIAILSRDLTESELDFFELDLTIAKDKKTALKHFKMSGIKYDITEKHKSAVFDLPETLA